MNKINNKTQIKDENIGTPFDDVFRTLLEKCSRLIVPVLNEVFHTDYSMDEKVTLLSNEHYFVEEDGSAGKRITDSCILIRKKLYHIECESKVNSAIEIRMIEYDFHIALSHRQDSHGEQILRFPESAVLMLRSTEKTPDYLKVKLIMPDGLEAFYKIPVVKVQQYSKEEIFNKNLLFFIPYYILRFEKNLKNIDEQDEKLKQLTDDYREIYNRLCELEKRNVIDNTYLHDLVGLTCRLIEVVARNTKNITREVVQMGGQVLELESEKILARGISQGISQGKIESILELLQECGTVPETLKKKISSQTDMEVLSKWHKLSARISSIEEFEEKM